MKNQQEVIKNFQNQKTKDEVEFTISIVSYNKINDLIRCLASIEKYSNGHSLEVYIVAYYFSKENIIRLQTEFQWIHILRSDEIRGFSENHNLALRKASGKYCIVLNDDTYFKNDVIGILNSSFNENPDAAIFSPLILNYDDSVQDCGRTKFGIIEFIQMRLRLNKAAYVKGHRNDVFQTYNISGAAFAIKTDVLKELDYFDERYFFCPEDIALSTLANKKGYKCYVNPAAIVYHLHSMNNITKVYQAIAPALEMGMAIFLGQKRITKYIVKIIIILISILKYLYWFVRKHDVRRTIMLPVYRNIITTIFSNKTPKEIFIEKINELNK